MKKLACEMCGSTELIKDGGVFVCGHCGVKYTLEEARRLMEDGPVEVKVDNSEKLQKLIRLARSAKDSQNYTEAAKYYAVISSEEPDNWEAVFYHSYFDVRQRQIGDIPFDVQKVIAAAKSAFFLIEQIEDPGERDRAASEIANSVNELAVNCRTEAGNQYNEVRSKNTALLVGYYRAMKSIHEMTYQVAEYLHESAVLSGELTVLAKINLYKQGIFTVVSKKVFDKESKMLIVQETEKVRAYDPQYIPPR